MPPDTIEVLPLKDIDSVIAPVTCSASRGDDTNNDSSILRSCLFYRNVQGIEIVKNNRHNLHQRVKKENGWNKQEKVHENEHSKVAERQEPKLYPRRSRHFKPVFCRILLKQGKLNISNIIQNINHSIPSSNPLPESSIL